MKTKILILAFVLFANIANAQLYVSASTGIATASFSKNAKVSSLGSFAVGWYIKDAIGIELCMSYIDQFTTNNEMTRYEDDGYNKMPTKFVMGKFSYNFLTDRIVSPNIGVGIGYGIVGRYSDDYYRYYNERNSRCSMPALSASVGASIRLSNSWYIFANAEVFYTFESRYFAQGLSLRIPIGVRLVF